MIRRIITFLCTIGSLRPLPAQVRASAVLRPAPVSWVVLAPGRWQSVQVVQVVDGDTYTVQTTTGRARVRLLGVDAPELSQPFGKQSADSVRARVLRRYVWLRAAGLDAYGRNLADVRLKPAAFSTAGPVALDSLLVVCGWAWAYSPGQPVTALATQQQQAQNDRRGLWKCGISSPIRPGIWRVYTKQEKARAWVGCPWY